MHRLINALDQRVRPADFGGPRSAALEVLGRRDRRRMAAELLFTHRVRATESSGGYA
jgi:hypothetical protein